MAFLKVKQSMDNLDISKEVAHFPVVRFYQKINIMWQIIVTRKQELAKNMATSGLVDDLLLCTVMHTDILILTYALHQALHCFSHCLTESRT